MHLNTRSTIVLLLLAFGVSAFGCVETTEQTDELATIPQEIVLFSAKPGIDSAAISYGYSKTDGWKLLRYADLQTATDLNGTMQARQQEMNFSGSSAPKGRFSGSLTGSAPVSGQHFTVSFSGGTQAYHSFQGKISGGTGLACSIYLICDFVESICDSAQSQIGTGIGSCKESVRECRNAVSQGMGSLNPKEEAQFCAIFDSILSGNFDFSGSFD